ncbi:MAG: tyrosine-type recombinase/integrase [bacterium]|nr:tyrosine-type recombinase/integrase [bacterium]
MSSLHAALSDYLAARRALGTQLAWPESSLRAFVDFVEAEGAEFVTTEIAMRWALRSVDVQPATHARRLSIVRVFAVWLQAVDARTQVPPPRLLPAKQRRPAPHIYTEDQIADLMTAASHLRSKSGMRGATFKVLVGLLAATGLRPGEALALDVGDVDLVEAVLTIRESKFGKSRFVSLDRSTRDALAVYATFRETAAPSRESSAFLVTARGTRPKACAARRTFAKLCQTVGLRRPQRRLSGHGPRLQDLRHTFATHRLIEWYRADLDVERLMPRLATYLGHASINETYWYIQAVPELMRLAAERQETVAEGGVQ